MADKTTNPKSSGIAKVTAPFYKILLLLLVVEYISEANHQANGTSKIMYICLLLIGLAQIYGIVYFFKNRRPAKSISEEEEESE